MAFLFLLSALLPTARSYGAPPDSLPDRRFGIVEAFWSPDQATELGVGWERVMFAWKALQPNSPNDWNQFYFPDETLGRELAQGREVVGLLMTSPAWASGSNDSRLPPKNLYLPYDNPNNYWGAFVKKIVSRYSGRIDSWIIWNEPDIWDARSNTSTWLGSEADYYQLLKVAYQAAKSVNPSAQIGFAGLTYWWDKAYGRDSYLKRVLDVAAKDPTAQANGSYFDFVDVHLYNLPQQMYDVPLFLKQVMAEYNLARPIWISEMNVVPHDDRVSPLPQGNYRASLEEQASFVIEASALALASGVERLAVYKMRDDVVQPANSEAYGVTRNDGSARPSFAAFRAVARYLSGARDARWYRSKDLNYVVVQRNGETTTVLWNNSPQPITAAIPAAAPGGTLVDKSGLGTGVIPSNGKYAIVLPGATADAPVDDPQGYFIGGDPFMLVEAGVRPPDLPQGRDQGSADQASRADEAKPPVVNNSRPKEEDLRVDPTPKAVTGPVESAVDQQQKAKEEADRLVRVTTLVSQTQALIDRYDWQGASARLQELNGIDPQNPKGRELQARVQREVKTLELQSRAAELYRLQDWQGAAEALRQLIFLYPDDQLLRAQLESALIENEKSQFLRLADDFLSQGRLDEAQLFYESVLKRDPVNRRALDGLANVHMLRWYQNRG